MNDIDNDVRLRAAPAGSCWAAAALRARIVSSRAGAPWRNAQARPPTYYPQRREKAVLLHSSC